MSQPAPSTRLHDYVVDSGEAEEYEPPTRYTTAKEQELHIDGPVWRRFWTDLDPRSVPGTARHRRSTNATNMSHAKKGWDVGLCGCFANLGTSILVFLTTPCVFGRTASKVGYGCCACGVLSCVPGVNALATCFVRSRVKRVRRIAEGAAKTVCVSIFCSPCATCQEAYELKDYKEDVSESTDDMERSF